ITGHVSIYKWNVIVTIIATCAPSLPIQIAIVVLRAKVLSKISQNSRKMSVKTMRVHRTLAKVLSLQAILSALFVIGIVDYFACQWNLVECTPVLEHMKMQAASFIPLFSPAITFHYMQPYQMYV
ncbi:hypothetical protein PMAYCL1PPCAC_16495, partial [Pristionchus mayeri]